MGLAHVLGSKNRFGRLKTGRRKMLTELDRAMAAEAFAQRLASLLEKIVTNYEILVQTNGATCLQWDETHLPRHWVGSRLERFIVEARDLLCVEDENGIREFDAPSVPPAFREEECGGAFDGFTVTSDADSGL
jgi:hypothetical protein